MEQIKSFTLRLNCLMQTSNPFLKWVLVYSGLAGWKEAPVHCRQVPDPQNHQTSPLPIQSLREITSLWKMLIFIYLTWHSSKGILLQLSFVISKATLVADQSVHSSLYYMGKQGPSTHWGSYLLLHPLSNLTEQTVQIPSFYTFIF